MSGGAPQAHENFVIVCFPRDQNDPRNHMTQPVRAATKNIALTESFCHDSQN